MQSHQLQWGVAQWVECLKDKALPVLPQTHARLAALKAAGREAQESLSARDMADIVFADPYLALKLLRRAEAGRSLQLAHETTTPLAAVLQTGFDELEGLVLGSAVSPAHREGHLRCERRSVRAACIARAWSLHRVDVSPDEVAMAALLAEIGELLLWLYAPDMAEEEAGIRDWNDQYWALAPRASEMVFTFRQLTVGLAQAWQLPGLVILLIRGVDNVRANISRLATEAAKSLEDQSPLDELLPVLLALLGMMPHAAPGELIAPLALEVEAAEALLARLTEARAAVPPTAG